MPSEEIIPSLCVVPIVGMHDDGGCGPFLGTAFFSGEQPKLVTCDHNLREWDGQYGLSTYEDGPRLYFARPLLRKPDVDLACLAVEEYQPNYSLPLGNDEDIIVNQMLNCFEYGETDVAGDRIDFSPSNRVGNVTRVRDLTDQFGSAGDRMLELSFPALRGASGAPVMLNHPPFNLWGVVKANVARELLPAQIERIYDEQGQIEEETRFLLPQGLAIHVTHVRDLLQAVGEM